MQLQQQQPRSGSTAAAGSAQMSPGLLPMHLGCAQQSGMAIDSVQSKTVGSPKDRFELKTGQAQHP